MMIEPPPVDSAVLASMAGDASFQHLFMANPQPMFIFEMVSLRFLAVNQAAMRHYGYSQHEFLAMTIKDIRPPEDIPALLTTLERVQAGLDDVPGIWRHLTKDGRILEVEISTHVIQLAGQKAKLALINDVTDRQKAERALREHEAQLRLFIEHAPAALAMFDQQMRYLAASRRWAEDYSVDGAALVGQSHYAVFPEIGLRWRALHQRALAGEVLRCEEDRFVRQDGSVQWLRWEMHPWLTDAQIVGGMVIFTEDISERKRTEETLRQSATIFESMRDGVLITDLTPTIIAVNPAYTDITGYTPEDALGCNPRILQSGRHDRGFYQSMWQNVVETGYWVGEVWNRRKSGELYPQLLSISAVKDTAGQPCNYVGVFTDISQIRQSEAQLAHLAHFDPLTGLPNRLLAYSRLEHAIERSGRARQRVAVLLIDIDRFKTINDSLGHAVGDTLLSAVATRLREHTPAAVDTLARLGGDEFLLVLDNMNDPGESASLAQTLLDALSAPFSLPDLPQVYLGASIGVSVYPDDAHDATELVQHADLAMYLAKQKGRNTYRFHTESMSRAAREQLTLETRLRHALDAGEFVLHYQPLLNADTHALAGVEALVRWQPPNETMVPPIKFIPLAEDSGLIIPLGDWVLRQACQQARAWLDAGAPPRVMAVNISARQFQHPLFVAGVRQALDDTGLPPACLELELTESMFMDQIEQSIHTMQQLKDFGVRLSIDDFGTGYSSLAYLKRFPIDKLKIDQSFVRGIAHDASDREITATIVAMARNLGLEVLAEGVETAEQLAFLQQLGCQFYQGYLFCKPLPAAQLQTWIDDLPAHIASLPACAGWHGTG